MMNKPTNHAGYHRQNFLKRLGRGVLSWPVWRRKILLVLLMALTVGVLLVVANSWLVIKKLNIEFANLWCDDQSSIERDLRFRGKNILKIDAKATQDLIKNKYKCVAGLRVEKNLPNGLNVSVVGRVPAAVLVIEASKSPMLDLKDLELSASTQAALLNFDKPIDNSELKYFVDAGGFIFSDRLEGVEAPEFITSDISLKLYKNYDTRRLTNSLELVNQLKELGIEPALLRLAGSGDLLIKTADGKQLVFSLSREVEIQIASLQLILQKNKIESSEVKTIDLRFNKPVVIYSSKLNK